MFIRCCQPFYVYDLTVDKAHTFYADGVLVHNCPWCEDMNGKTMALGGNYFALGEQMTVDGQSMRFDYDSVQYPPLHPQCRCTLIPVLREVGVQKTAEEVRQEVLDYADKVEPEIQQMWETVWKKEAQNVENWEKFYTGTGEAAQEAKRQALALSEEITKDYARITAKENRMKAALRRKLYANAEGTDMNYSGTLTHLLPKPPSASELSAFEKRFQKELKHFSQYVDSDILPGDTIGAYMISKGERAYALGDYVYLHAESGSADIVHELGHWLERHNPTIKAKARQFLEDRTKGEPLLKLNKTPFGAGYGNDEVYRKDKFLHPYMGKIYKHDSTEIISMGLEGFEHGGINLARNDPEYFRFIYNLVRGL